MLSRFSSDDRHRIESFRLSGNQQAMLTTPSKLWESHLCYFVAIYVKQNTEFHIHVDFEEYWQSWIKDVKQRQQALYY